jgi:hypothetical protein
MGCLSELGSRIYLPIPLVCGFIQLLGLLTMREYRLNEVSDTILVAGGHPVCLSSASSMDSIPSLSLKLLLLTLGRLKSS